MHPTKPVVEQQVPQYWKTNKDNDRVPVVPRGPNDQNPNKGLDYEFDYTKNYQDPLLERPGHSHLNLGSGCCTEAAGIGKMQTPINLDTRLAVKQSFKDSMFEFNYEPFDPVAVKKFNEKGSTFVYELNGDEDYLITKTVGLFDRHLKGKYTKFYGMQTHFHAPSEHSIDG